MTGEGTVLKTAGIHATVRIEKKSACSGECSSCGICQNCVYDVEVKNTAGAKVGDKVKLYMPTAKVYVAAFMGYMLPILAVFITLGICYVLSAPHYATAMVCAAALAGWIYVTRRYNNNTNLESEITEIVNENP